MRMTKIERIEGLINMSIHTDGILFLSLQTKRISTERKRTEKKSVYLSMDVGFAVSCQEKRNTASSDYSTIATSHFLSSPS